MMPHRAQSVSTEHSPYSSRARLLGACVAAVMVAGVFGCTNSDDPSDANSPSGALPSQPMSPPPKDGGLDVVEQGVSGSDDTGTVSYGVMLKNSTDAVAFMTKATVTLVDSEGKKLESGGDSELLQQDITVVRPGEKIGFGATVPSDAVDDVDHLTLKTDTDEWWAAKNSTYQFAKLTTSDVSVDDHGADGATISYNVTSRSKEALPTAYDSAVFRDVHGDIVGGAAPGEPHGLPSGKSNAKLNAEYGLPKHADDNRTKVYVIGQV